MIPTKIKQIAICVALATGVYMPVAEAASLGKIHVKSALGQPLRAELELNANSKEISSISVKLAPLSSFQRAEIPYTNTLSTLRFTIDKDPNKPLIRITSDKPIFDPFFDFLLEMSWANGNLIREYTFLLDPIDQSPKLGDGPVINSPVETEAPRSSTTYTANPEYSPPPVEQFNKPVQTAIATPPAAPVGVPAVAEEEWLVKRGDTLSRIASQTKPAGVSLDQMLFSLYKNNKEAFQTNNMNRLKAGVILSLPDAESAKAVSNREARAEIVAHAADWNAYRRKLAEATDNLPTRPEAESTQSSGGSVSNITDKNASDANNRDQLKVSASSASKKPGASEEDVIAKERAMKEANERVAQLEQNLTDLQKLVELKNKSAAALNAAPAAPETTEPAVVVPVASPVVPETSPVPVEPKPEAPVAPAPEPTTANANANVPPPEPDEPEPPTLIEKAIEFLGLPEVWAATGGLLALLLSYFAIRALRSNRDDNEFDAFADLEDKHTPLVDDELHEDSFESDVTNSFTNAGRVEEVKPIEQTMDVEIEEIEAIEPEPMPVPPEVQPEPAPSFDYASVNLDLTSESNEPTPSPITTIDADSEPEVEQEAEPEDPPNEEATTKLLLANAYVEMGDSSGARDLLNEVLQEGSNTQKKEATALLASLSADNDEESAPALNTPTPIVEENEFATMAEDDLTGNEGEADEVNPIAEADVMIAYGRETQAEEILVDALNLTPDNTAIHSRLLDIYTRREARLEFDNIAKALFTLTQGKGPEWDKALAQAASLELDINPPALASPGEQAFEAGQSAPLPITTPAADEPAEIDGPEEVSTKLDLMQAYLEMGDSDGARELLNEIQAEGSDSQKAEANRLMESLA